MAFYPCFEPFVAVFLIFLKDFVAVGDGMLAADCTTASRSFEGADLEGLIRSARTTTRPTDNEGRGALLQIPGSLH